MSPLVAVSQHALPDHSTAIVYADTEHGVCVGSGVGSGADVGYKPWKGAPVGLLSAQKNKKSLYNYTVFCLASQVLSPPIPWSLNPPPPVDSVEWAANNDATCNKQRRGMAA